MASRGWLNSGVVNCFICQILQYIKNDQGESGMSSGTMLIFITILVIALLLFLVMKSKLQACVALLISSLFIGIASGMDLSEVIDSIESGMGGTLGFIAVVVGL